METETLDKLYLEWSNFTKARNQRENDCLQKAIAIFWMLQGDAPNKIEEAKNLATDIQTILSTSY